MLLVPAIVTHVSVVPSYRIDRDTMFIIFGPEVCTSMPLRIFEEGWWISGGLMADHRARQAQVIPFRGAVALPPDHRCRS